MIPRYQRILFLVLVTGSLLMAGYLVYLHGHQSQVKNADNTPLEAPPYSTAAEEVTLVIANDADGSVTPVQRNFALPEEPAVRARALLDHLLAEYTRPNNPHLLGGGVAVDDVYLVDLPLGSHVATPAGMATAAAAAVEAAIAGTPAAKAINADPLAQATGKLAVVNLRSAWADAHPSGITSETLTIQSILGTLHANLPDITEVRFLVDGRPRSTLAGNVVFDRVYDAADLPSTTTQGTQQ